MESNQSTWIVGYGDIGRRLACLYSEKLKVTVRSKASHKKVLLEGHEVYELNLDNDFTELSSMVLTDLSNSRLFYCIAPPKTGQQDTRLKKFLKILSVQSIHPQHIVLISTTGVYGHCDGQWVDESADIKPAADRAYRRVDAEQQLMQWAKYYKKSYIILRVSGIYAEDRLPLARIAKGLPIVRASESPWTNRIHADDLAMICYQAMGCNKKAEIYNVSDGNPSTMADYFNTVADYASLARPPQITLQQAEEELSKGMMSYMKESRRITNMKMLKELEIQLRYPSLSDCLKINSSPP